ncbi:MAG: glycosyltransferase [Lentisphaeria bacterium]|nr:glycosyltransferase [Lentisphaeria bacterium]
MKKFLLLGGKPIGSVDILNYAREQGYYIIVCDYLPVEESPCKQLADECWDFSTADVDAIVEKAKTSGVDAVFTGCHEFNIARCIEICERLNLPCYATLEMWERCSNKQYYKAVWEKNGIEVIPEYQVDSEKLAQSDIEYPILLKPVDGSGARGITICASESDVAASCSKALEYSKSGVFIAEKYIENKDEITIVYIVKDGVPYLAALADRLVFRFDKKYIPLPVGYIWTSRYLELYREICDEKMKKSLTDMGIQNGMVFIQAIVKDEHIYPYDMGWRISGTQEHIIFENVCGFNPLKLLTDYALGKGFGDDRLVEKINPEFNESAAQITFLGCVGKIGKFHGIEDVEKLSGVIRVVKNHSEGEEIPEAACGTLNKILLRVFLQATDKTALYELINQVQHTINIFSENGSSMLIFAPSSLYYFALFPEKKSLWNAYRSKRIFPKKDVFTRDQVNSFLAKREELLPLLRMMQPCLQKLKAIRENKEYLLTVLLSSYNHSGSIDAAILSVLEQETTYPYLLKIIDDCSSDSTSERCLFYAVNYPDRVEYCPEPINTGSVSITAHVRQIKTKYFARLDGDDRWCHPQKIQKALDFLESHPEYMAYTHDAVFYNKKKGVKYSYTHVAKGIENPPETYTFENFFYTHLSARIHRNSIDFTKEYPNVRLRDIYLFYFALDRGPFYYCDEIMSEYVFHENGVWGGLTKTETQYSYNYRRYMINKYTNYRHEKVLRMETKSKLLNVLVCLMGKRIAWPIYTLYRKYILLLKNVVAMKKNMEFIEYKHEDYSKKERSVRDEVWTNSF